MVKGYLKILVLKELQVKDCSGYDLMKTLQEHDGKKVSAGSMYPLLGELEQQGLIKTTQEDNANLRTKKTYRITPEGKRRLVRLVKEKETLMQDSLNVLRSFHKIDPNEETADFITFFEETQRKGDILFPLGHELLSLKRALVDKLGKKKQSQAELREILATAIKKVNNL